MSRYFSKLAKRTGIAANSAEKMRRQTARVNIRSAFEPNKRASLKRGLEANVGKIVEPAGSQRNSVTESSISTDSRPGLQGPAKKDVLTSVSNESPEESEFSAREHDPLHSLKAGSVKKVIDDDTAANLPKSSGMPEGDNQLHETSSETTAVKNDEPDNVLLTEKRQYIASPSHRAPRQNHFDKSEMANNLSMSKSERQHIGEEKTIEVKTISPESESREARESGDDSFFDPMPYTRIKKTPSTSLAAIESSEKTRVPSGTRTIHIVPERGRTAETNLEKAESPAHDNSVDIHIGTISFEVHQAPEKKTVTNPLPPAPRPVAKQQTHFPNRPRLSRYYLRGM